MAFGVGPGVFRSSRSRRADPAGDLHDQCDREPEQHVAPGEPEAGHFPNDCAATRLIHLALRGVASKWRRPRRFWQTARSEFSLVSGDRFLEEAS